MICTENKYAYKAFGLKVMSEIPLPELPQMGENGEEIKTEEIDVVIEMADFSESRSQFILPEKKIVAQKDLLVFELPDTAFFCVQEGRKIIVSPMEDSNEDVIKLYILGICMSALLLQRKVLTLHGSALAIDGKAYGFVGISGAGKSTLAAALLSRGYQLLSDDVIPISLSDKNIPFVMPAFPQQKLWQETLKEFGMQKENYNPIFQKETKYAVPVSSKFSSEPLPLAGVFELVKVESDQVEIRRIPKLERLQSLFRHTYNKLLLSHFDLMHWHFSTSINIINQIELFQLIRPNRGFTANQMASQILDVINEGGATHGREQEYCIR